MDTTGAMALPEAANTSLAGNSESMEFAVPSRPRLISSIRHRVRKFARSIAFTADEIDDIGIAVGEAATNALKYGTGFPGQSQIEVRLRKTHDTLWVYISDTGPGFEPSKVCPPGAGDLRECGRGIMCMYSLMDEVRFHSLDPGTCVEMVKKTRS